MPADDPGSRDSRRIPLEPAIYHDESCEVSHGSDAQHEPEFRIGDRLATELSQSPCRKPAPLDDKPGKMVMPG